MMALLAMFGFDDSVLEADWVSNSQFPQFIVGRDGIGQCAHSQSNHFDIAWTPATIATVGNTYYIGFAYKTGGNYNGTAAILNLGAYNSSSVLVYTGVVGLTNVGRVTIGSSVSNFTLPVGVWAYFEISVLVNALSWTVNLRVNGQTVLTNVVVTPPASQPTAFTAIDFVTGTVSLSNYGSLDDMYVADNTGTINNTFLGDCYVRTMLPIGNGASSQFTNSAGTSVNNYSYVDEQNSSSVDYVGAAAAGLEDLYTILDGTHPIPNDYVVHAIQGLVYAGKSDSGTPPNLSYTGRGVVGTVRKDAVNFNLGTSYTSQNSTIQITDPDGNALTPATVNNMQIGVVTS